MAGNISAEEGALRDGAKAVNETEQGLTGHMTAIRSAVSEARGTWDGPSAARFEQLSQAWEAEVKKLNRTLSDFENSLIQTHQDQERDEEDNTSEIGNIDSVMAG